MKKNYLKLALFSTVLSLFPYSCDRTSEMNVGKDVSVGNSLYTKQENRLLQNKYGFTSISSYVNKSGNLDFGFFDKGTNSMFNLLPNEELDLTKVTTVDWGNEGTSYIIHFKNNFNKFFVFSVKNGDKIDVNKGVVVENLVDDLGNGKIVFTTIDGKNIDEIEKGKKTGSKNIYGKRTPFKVCFEQAYDDICDDFIGCVAWYTNPQVALLAAAYCGIKTY